MFKTTMVCVVIFSSIISTMLVVSMAYSPYVILSGSMEPTLHVGDVVMV
ncbi:MAG: signal peptidase I, partial [Candidatus Lokiarchaeota archaeon]|nr:signal peptidase I [Candidatus Lokiarchaeota archaeon]